VLGSADSPDEFLEFRAIKSTIKTKDSGKSSRKVVS
jgi:hypothetical protein